jgi:hypothetical protein
MNCNAPWVVHIIVGHHYKFMVGIVIVTNWAWVKTYYQSTKL